MSLPRGDSDQSNTAFIDGDEVRKIFSEKLAQNGSLDSTSLHKAYHQYPNPLPLTSALLRQGIDKFQTELLGSNPAHISSLLSGEEYAQGMAAFDHKLANAENADEIMHQMELLCVKLSGNDPEQFARMLNLPAMLEQEDVLMLMRQIEAYKPEKGGRRKSKY